MSLTYLGNSTGSKRKMIISYAGRAARAMMPYAYNAALGRYGSAANQQERRTRAVARRNVVPKTKLDKQLRTLLAGKTRDAVDVYNNFALETDGNWASCLTSTTQTESAAVATGVVIADTDTAMINHVHTKGYIHSEAIQITPTMLTQALYVTNPRVRTLYVWYNHMDTAPVPGGTLPSVLEVLKTATVNSHFVPDTQNSGKFTVLFDKVYTLHRNWILSGAGAGDSASAPTGTYIVNVDDVIKIGKRQHYASSAGTVLNTNAGGHYDSTGASGRVTSGLLIRYMILDAGEGNGLFKAIRIGGQLTDRLNYTA